MQLSEYHPCLSGLIGVAQLAKNVKIVVIDGGLDHMAGILPQSFVLKNCQHMPRDWITRLFEAAPRFTSTLHLENVHLSNDLVEILERHLPHARKVILRDIDFDEGSLFENENCLIANPWTHVSLGTAYRPWEHDDIVRILRYCWNQEIDQKRSASELTAEVMESAERYAGGGTLLLCAGNQISACRFAEAVEALRKSRAELLKRAHSVWTLKMRSRGALSSAKVASSVQNVEGWGLRERRCIVKFGLKLSSWPIVRKLTYERPSASVPDLSACYIVDELQHARPRSSILSNYVTRAKFPAAKQRSRSYRDVKRRAGDPGLGLSGHTHEL
ncbi:hypothetical protein BDZ88DRAFT_440826 [Geranomyces variabilis]|nr:hypothetical protein BDZ88DRAFT_440826 [Geranomyces variabilis]